ncbi:DUF3300 domain-containing protein [Acidovorax sp. NCPPB 3576]|uniref:DUF3300 domain-containing protein n=1 Tax=Acidovorax sp. NCPPB 3576 TaxID=2940488 RepID=UPI00234BBAEB|nr:DUF3300 domain-containing protein [Acidovorax sp. NCPPB 3576]WCM89576.1 DUF3300 domain-containing protein [Acidovorax sp. NCPPB 3576]
MAPLADPRASDPRVAFPFVPAAFRLSRTPNLLAASRGMALSLIAACTLTACNRQNSSPSVPPPAPSAATAPAAAPAPEAAPVAVRYTPPSADALYQMVAPIALYPDKLVAQVLAGATYPDQVTAAETWLGQNPSLKAAALTDAVDQQPWDPSIKSLTAFPNVLEQMASNLPWTVALGKAYYNDPTDVMNAIQVMRSRATKAGTLKSSPHLRVATVTAAPPSPPPPADLQQPVVMYSGPAVVVPPPAYISIEPADVQAVYVPRYDPQVVYGTPVPLYSSYRWATPAPVYSSGGVVGADPVAVGALAFGAGVLVGAVASHHHHWGWDAWGVNWGRPPERAAWVQGAPLPPPVVRPAVVYRGNTYISQSRTVVENIHNRVTVNNIYERTPEGGRPPAVAAAMPVAPAAAMAAMNPMASPIPRDRDPRAMAQAAMPHGPGQDRHAVSPGQAGQTGQSGMQPSPQSQALAMQPQALHGAHEPQPAARADERSQAQRAAMQRAQPSHPGLPAQAADHKPAPGAAPMHRLAAAPSNRPEVPEPHAVQAAQVPGTSGQALHHGNPHPPVIAGPGAQAQAQAQRAMSRPEHVSHMAPQGPAQGAAEHAQMRTPPPAMPRPAPAVPPQERAAPRPAVQPPPHAVPAPAQHGHGAEPAHRPEGHRHGET